MKTKGFFPTEIIFSTTNACNLNCPHCFVKKSTQKLDVQNAKYLIEECCNFQDSSNFPFINKIGFTGGEPFLYKEFLFEVTKFAIEKDFLFDQIMTNGCWWKTEEELSQTLQDLYDAGFDGKIGLSWDVFHNQDEEKIPKDLQNSSLDIINLFDFLSAENANNRDSQKVISDFANKDKLFNLLKYFRGRGLVKLP